MEQPLAEWNMIKSELISELQKKFPQIPEKDVVDCVNLLLEQMSKHLSHGKRIEIRGFGSFSLHYHGPRNAHNPKTGAKVLTEGKYTVHFKPGKELRERVNQSRSNIPIVEDADENTESERDAD